MAELEQELAGFEFAPASAGDWPAIAGTSIDPIGPAVVLVEVEASFVVMTLSYELTLDELSAWTAQLARVTEAEWIAQGGVVGAR